ncbi:hypothetical protein HanRHA438_Chr08g0353961 [Helianthus annuus]|nr:hypothetical protein HanRHA438_Chr08g0353961 [Helianthus annuus]
MAEQMNSSLQGVDAKDIIVGFQHLSSSVEEKTFKPSVSSSITLVVGLIFSSLDATYDFYQTYAKRGGFCVRKGFQVEENCIITYNYFTC